MCCAACSRSCWRLAVDFVTGDAAGFGVRVLAGVGLGDGGGGCGGGDGGGDGGGGDVRCCCCCCWMQCA